jgi:alpha-galactosidase
MNRILACVTTRVVAVQLHAKPLKVFIPAGQSNMEGHARIKTYDDSGDAPATTRLLKMIRRADGRPTVAEGARILHLTGRYDGSANGESTGRITVAP